jgi:membrane dipeptidase
MERLGMLVDLAHVNGAGIEDALAMLRQPYVVSHTACRALHDVPRNLSDEQIRSVAEHGGVVGMAFGRSFLGRPGLAGLLDHLEHAIRVGGADAVALGSDYDGAIVPATGLGDVTVLPRITAGLLARGQSHETVRKVMGENALRVLTEVCG